MKFDFHVDDDIRKAESLPPEAFVEPEFLKLELDTIFKHHWLFVPQRPMAELRDDPRSLAAMMSRRGARAPVSILDKPLFLQRDWKGKLHLFPNVCTHAWHTLVPGPDRQRTITCPQHGRQFDCEGKFVTQPGFDEKRACDHLADFPVEAWEEFFFASLGEPAASFSDFTSPMRDSLANMPLDEFRRRPVAGEVRELDGNWKQHAWNYMDRMHIPHIHKKPGGLAEAIDMASYQTELFPHSSLQWAYAKNPEHGFDPDVLPKRFHKPGRKVFTLWWFLFPNLTLNFYPWGLSVNAYMPVPDKPTRTLFLWYHYVWNEEKYKKKEELWLSREVDDEDVDALSQVRRGVVSGFAVRGRFSPDEETGPHWFHRLVSRTVAL